MGIFIFYAAMAVAAGAEVASSMAASNAAAAAASAQEQTVRTQSLAQELKIADKKERTVAKLNEIVGKNEVVMATKGLSAQSPSYQAVQLDTIRKGQVALHQGTVAQQAVQLSAQSEVGYLQIAERDQQNAIFFKTVGGLASIAGSMAGAGAFGGATKGGSLFG